jgi:hypothetical protein
MGASQWKEEAIMVTLKVAMAGVILAGSVGVIGAPVSHADPFNPAEQQFLNDVRPRLQGYGDARASAMSDADLVGEGWWACHDLAVGISPQSQGINPLIGTYAKSDLCPNGCPQGCGHRQ